MLYEHRWLRHETPSWSELDNIFPEVENCSWSFCDEFAENIKGYSMSEGDILEFGVACMGTITNLAEFHPTRKVFGIDHFKGLEETNQPTPEYAGWYPCAFALGDPNHSGMQCTLEELLDRVKSYDNVNIIVEDIHDLKDPTEYGIAKVSAVHIDVDIYEPTVSALNFLDKCEWDKIYMRFDDWHGHEPDYDNHERLACREWLTKNNYKYELMENGLAGMMVVFR